MRLMNNKIHNDIVYIAYKEPMNQHPQKCRIGVCAGMPVLDEGWRLFSFARGEYADKIYSDILGSLNDVGGTNYDSENEAWLLPINGLDRLLAAEAKDDKFQLQYFKDRQDPTKTNPSGSGIDWGKTT
jgi:hypothetical protein